MEARRVTVGEIASCRSQQRVKTCLTIAMDSGHSATSRSALRSTDDRVFSFVCGSHISLLSPCSAKWELHHFVL